ncbi:MAG TPA: preprotein translocase subunit SecE [Lentisphaeria bacterium]|nr:MAG: preprotein translocase subunit SecE [Lentisphaerae bacterium GWF2_50_93]HCE44187.1 preprotein translocase subunit SecE [Lentisphaeria bacterium]
MGNWITKARLFIGETINELKKCSWPDRSQLFESTVLVIVTVLLLASFVAVVDFISMKVISFLTM